MKTLRTMVIGLAVVGLAGAAAPAALAAKGTVGVPGCSVTYDTGTATVNPSTGQLSYSGPSVSADTSSCVPETPPHLG